MRPGHLLLVSALGLSLWVPFCHCLKPQASFITPDYYPDFLRGDTRELKYIPGVGYADPFAIALIASVPVLILIGFGIFFAPLIALIPKFLAIPGIGIPAGVGVGGVGGLGGLGGLGGVAGGIGPIGTRTRRSSSTASPFNAEKIASILKSLEAALDMFGNKSKK